MNAIHIIGAGKPLKVVAPEFSHFEGEDPTPLTAGKEYTVTGYWSDSILEKGWGCIITDDNGYDNHYIDEINDFELNGKNWIVTERENI